MELKGKGWVSGHQRNDILPKSLARIKNIKNSNKT
jgi:hypothetical protein